MLNIIIRELQIQTTMQIQTVHPLEWLKLNSVSLIESCAVHYGSYLNLTEIK